MHPRTIAFRATFDAAAPELTPVAVTRWTARLIEPQCEQDYLVHRFHDDRRRAMFLMGLVALANGLSFLVELSTYGFGASGFSMLIPAVVPVWLPIVGLLIVRSLRSQRLLEVVMVASATIGTVTRLSVLTLHPILAGTWPTLMVGIVLVIYLYLPIRFVISVGLAVAFSILAPLWWSLALGPLLPPELFYRGLIVLGLVNALGFVAANSMQRSQRTQYALSLVLRQLLSTDALTGIANRRRFDDALDREWRRCARSGMPLSLLMIDVDHFKAYNDYCGHLQGDDCLRQVAKLLVEGIGRPGDLVARYGGEEFVCLLPNIGTAGALVVANKLVAAVRNANISHPFAPSGPRLTISVGAATVTEMSGDPMALVAYADKLLYAAKAAGRDQVKVDRLIANGAAGRAA